MKFSDFKNDLNKNISKKSSSGDLSQRYRDLDSILSVVKNINSTIELDDVLAVVLTHAIEISKAERGFIVLSDEEGELEYKLGLDEKGNRLPEKSFRISQSVAEDVFRTGKSKFIEGAQNDTGQLPTKSILELSLQTILCAPLKANNKKIGVIYVDNKKITKAKDRELNFTFEILAEHASTAIRNAQLFKNIKNAKKKSEVSQDLKLEFMAQMSHEVRTPLNTIINFSHMLKEDLHENLPPEIKTSLDLIESSGLRIIKSFDLLLNMAELKTGTYEFTPRNLDLLKHIIIPVYNDYKNMATDKKLEFKIYQRSEKLEIIGDEYTLSLLFNNLISNALKFTIQGHIHVIISEIPSLNKISIEINDSGIGISPEVLAHVFDSDLKLKGNSIEAGNYSGLGLILARKYADMNNAEFTITSEKGKGTTVTLLFEPI
jgi:signal transduction histidine kinase